MESVKIYVLSLSTAIKDAPSIIPNGRFEIVVEWNCGVHTLKLSTSTQFIRHYDRGIDQASVYRGVEGEGRLNRPSVVHAKVIDLESRETMFSGQHAVDAFSAFKNTSWELIKLYATVKDGISTDVRQGSAVLDLKIKVGRVHHMINLNIVSANDFVQAPDLTTRIERFPFNQDVWVMIDGPHEWTERRRLEDGMVEVRSFDCNREIADIIENGSSEINRVIGKWRRTLHANVVTPIGYSLHDCISIVYPLLRRGQENVDILSYIREFGATTLQRERMIRDVAEGLNFLHAMGIVHGNMRGANILIAGDGRAVVTGYGLNDILRHTSDAQVGMSDLRWNSPETVRTSPGDIRGLATKKSDIWGFGCTVYEIYSLKLPYSVLRSEVKIEACIIGGIKPWYEGDINAYGKILQGFSEEMQELVKRCCRYNKERRPTAEMIARDLEAMVARNEGDEPVEAA